MNPILVLIGLVWLGSRLLSKTESSCSGESSCTDELMYDVDLMCFDPRAKLSLIYCECGFTAIPWELEITTHNEVCPKCNTQCHTHSDVELITIYLGRDSQCKPIFRTFDPNSKTDKFDFNREVARAMLTETWNQVDWEDGGLERMRIDQLRMSGYSELEASDMVCKVGWIPEL